MLLQPGVPSLPALLDRYTSGGVRLQWWLFSSGPHLVRAGGGGGGAFAPQARVAVKLPALLRHGCTTRLPRCYLPLVSYLITRLAHPPHPHPHPHPTPPPHPIKHTPHPHQVRPSGGVLASYTACCQQDEVEQRWTKTFLQPARAVGPLVSREPLCFTRGMGRCSGTAMWQSRLLAPRVTRRYERSGTCITSLPPPPPPPPPTHHHHALQSAHVFVYKEGWGVVDTSERVPVDTPEDPVNTHGNTKHVRRRRLPGANSGAGSTRAVGLNCAVQRGERRQSGGKQQA